MILTFLKKERNRRLILIFTGWGSGPELYRDVDIPGWDVAVAFKFNNDRFDHDALEEYDTIYLFAWSLGVFMADRIMAGRNVTRAFAINGTVTPVSDTNGIPQAIFQGTADTLSPRNLTKFRRRTMPDSETFRKVFPEEPSAIMAEGLATQLEYVAQISRDTDKKPALEWTRAYIGKNDRIFPPENMERAWAIDPEVELVRTGDAHFMDIPAVIRSVIADTHRVSDRFRKAAESYDSHAIPQRMIALHLMSLLNRYLPKDSITETLLEIGPGTGILTNEWCRRLQPSHTDFVDIASMGTLSAPGGYAFYQTDAETWITAQPDNTYDLILSSSVIQWFADIPAFLRQCRRILKPGGTLAVATFAPGNLSELDALRPAPLLYPTPESIKNAEHPDFRLLHIEQATIRMEFESHRHLLMHLKRTGVAGSASPVPANKDSVSDYASLSSLTYKPLYFILTKK